MPVDIATLAKRRIPGHALEREFYHCERVFELEMEHTFLKC